MDMFICAHSELSDEELEKRKYVFPEERKFPLPDKAHVLSAIKFFNYVEPSKEKILASAILKRMKEYGMINVNVGKDNRFSKYYHPKETIQHEGITMEKFLVISEEDYIAHHGIKGQKWGVRRYQNADGSLTPAGLARYGHLYSKNGKMKTNVKGDTSTTRAVKKDYNNLSDKEFLQKYKTTKSDYNKRVMKSGDPFKANKKGREKLAKKYGNTSNARNDALNARRDLEESSLTNRQKSQLKKSEKKITKLEKDIASFEPIKGKGVKVESGLMKGTVLLTAGDVRKSINSLEKMKKEEIAKIQKSGIGEQLISDMFDRISFEKSDYTNKVMDKYNKVMDKYKYHL